MYSKKRGFEITQTIEKIEPYFASSPSNHELPTLFSHLLHVMKEQHQLTLPDLIALYRKQARDEHAVPLTLFALQLSPSEALCKYLKEQGYAFHEMARLLNRDARSVWTSYRRAQRKHQQPFSPVHSEIILPLSLFKRRELSIFENVVWHLHTLQYSNKAIAQLLKRQPQVIATVLHRAREKQQVRYK